MPSATRRSFLKSASIAATAGLMANSSWAKVPIAARCVSSTRYSASSTQGKAMLAIYAGAVGKMMNLSLFPEANPRSWTFQWYTHSVRSDRGKQVELDRVFPANATPGRPAIEGRALAEKMWETCRSHHDEPEDLFLPWHRLYVRYFEEIIRSVSGETCFTLPYWDYTNPRERALPEEFRQEGHPIWGPLYRKDRFSVVNDGQDVTMSPGHGALDLNCMKSSVYSESSADAGFCSNLDQAPHGALHEDVGTNLGMGQVPWAANDPIFWLHHCNIDRIWASWNFAGGRNPDDSTFLNTAFSFADGMGNEVTAYVKDTLSIPKDSYDRYLQRPNGSIPFPSRIPSQVTTFSLRIENAKPEEPVEPVLLKPTPVTIPLTGQPPTAGTNFAESFAKQIRALKPDKPVHLFLQGISANGPVSGVFDVYIHVGTQPAHATTDSPEFVGQINFFGSSHAHGGGEGLRRPRSASFVLSASTRKALSQGNAEPAVTFVPRAEFSESAAPSVARVRLLSE